MTTLSATWNTSVGGSQALQILKDAPPSGYQSVMQYAQDNPTSSYAFISGAEQTGRAAAVIMNILLDAQGNVQLGIVAKQGYVSARTGDGNDTVSMDVNQAAGVWAGGGNDNMVIRAYANEQAHYDPGLFRAVSDVYGGDGDDHIYVTSYGESQPTTDGADAENTSATNPGEIDIVYGGSGDDTIDIQGRMIWVAEGGDGNDAIDVRGTAISNIAGGDGDDTIRITATADNIVAGQAERIQGGNGNETIEVTADVIGVAGDKGDDTITLNNTGTFAADIRVMAGDGHDTVTTNGAVSIVRFNGANRPDDLGKVAIVDRIDDNTVKVSYADTDDTITLHLTGEMAGKPLAIDFHLGGSLVIRDASIPDNALPSCLAAVKPVVQTRSI